MCLCCTSNVHFPRLGKCWKKKIGSEKLVEARHWGKAWELGMYDVQFCLGSSCIFPSCKLNIVYMLFYSVFLNPFRQEFLYIFVTSFNR